MRVYQVLTQAIEDILAHGFDAQWRIEQWLSRLAQALERQYGPAEQSESALRAALLGVFERATRADVLARQHPEISAFTIEQIAPKLRAELDRRILASADLIRLHREESMARTLRRMAGWMTSIPAGGTEVAQRAKVKKEVRRSIAGLPFEERRVVIDQGHKLAAAINEIISTDGGAIAAVWHSHWRESGYQFRPEHKALDGKVFLVRGSWAQAEGLVKLAGRQYTDEVEAPSREPFCRCYWQFLYNLRQLPAEMLTAKGHAALEQARERLSA